MCKWSKAECRRRNQALLKPGCSYEDISEVVRTRDRRQCKSHLQKVGNYFRKLAEVRDQQEYEMSVYNSHLMYLSLLPCASSDSDVVKVSTPREISRVQEDFLLPPLGDDFALFQEIEATLIAGSSLIVPKE